MAKRYEHVTDLAREISEHRSRRGLTFEKLGYLAEVNPAQTFRICRAEFKTLNPSVLRICNVLGIQPKAGARVLHAVGDDGFEAMLSAEVLTAWDRTEAGAKFLRRVLRALHSET